MPGGSVRAAAAAVAFLTRVPIGRRLELGADDVGRSVVFFPLVGAAVGAVAGLAAEGLDGRLPLIATGGLALAVALLLTGALHLDALADTADALGARTRDRALEIMRDSRIGTFGAAAIAVDVVVKASLIGAAATGANAVALLAAAGAVSRAASPPLARLLPYARAEGGPGSVLSGRVSGVGAAGGAVVAAALAVGLAGADGAAAVGLAAAVALAGGLLCRAWLGGVTGDTLGAVTEVAELGALALLVALA
jgi:cobalamin 5'-phosphate synthase/cobalamin synthase